MIEANNLAEYLRNEYKGEILYAEKNTILGFVQDIKVDFLAHQYPLINPINTVDGIRLVSLQDIAAMKLNVIIRSGSRIKDFVDISCLLEYFPLEKLLSSYEKKYPEGRTIIATQALLYHEEIDFMCLFHLQHLMIGIGIR